VELAKGTQAGLDESSTDKLFDAAN